MEALVHMWAIYRVAAILLGSYIILNNIFIPNDLLLCRGPFHDVVGRNSKMGSTTEYKVQVPCK